MRPDAECRCHAKVSTSTVTFTFSAASGCGGLRAKGARCNGVAKAQTGRSSSPVEDSPWEYSGVKIRLLETAAIAVIKGPQCNRSSGSSRRREGGPVKRALQAAEGSVAAGVAGRHWDWGGRWCRGADEEDAGAGGTGQQGWTGQVARKCARARCGLAWAWAWARARCNKMMMKSCQAKFQSAKPAKLECGRCTLISGGRRRTSKSTATPRSMMMMIP